MGPVNTQNFRTRHEFGSLTYPKGKSYIIGLDVGYSGTKVFHETGYMCFPSFAKKMGENMMDLPDEKDIFFRDDNTGDVYLVGRNAQKLVDDTNDTDKELYGRNRYSDVRFRIICYTAIGLAVMKKKENDNRKIVVQTGLPASYMMDADAFKKAISSISKFSLKVGYQKEWTSFDFSIPTSDVFVMAQPMGALHSVITKNDGNFITDAKAMLTGSVMVMDAGFGTFDFYGIKERTVVCQESLLEFGMQEIFTRCVKDIKEKYGEDIRVSALHKNLDTGYIECFDEEEMTSDEKPFGQFLSKASEEVLGEAKLKIRSVTDAFRGYRYIIIDGGTGEAWYEDICKWLGNMKTIKIIPSNINDKLPFSYSNARGYYMFRYVRDKR